MATDFGGMDITCAAGVDLTGKKYLAVKMSSDGQIDPASSQGEACLGILQSEAATAGDSVRVRVDGTSVVEIGAAVEEGAELQADTDGQLITALAADYVVAIALQPGANAGDHIRALLVHYQKNA